MQINRRNLLGGALALPAIAATPTAAATIASNPEWNRLVAAYRVANARQEALLPAFNAAEAEFNRRKPAAPVQPSPPALDTSRSLRDIIATATPPGWAEYEKAHTAWKAELETLRGEVLDGPEQAWWGALRNETAALSELAAFPAPSLAIAAEKASILSAELGDDLGAGDWAKHIVADLHRLAKREG